MDNDRSREANRGTEGAMSDMDEGLHVGFISADEFENRARTETHRHGSRQERSQHIDLTAEEYTPDEVARLIGTSLEVVVRAARSGDLKAERAGHNIVCIKHEDVVDWLQRRGPGV